MCDQAWLCPGHAFMPVSAWNVLGLLKSYLFSVIVSGFVISAIHHIFLTCCHQNICLALSPFVFCSLPPQQASLSLDQLLLIEVKFLCIGKAAGSLNSMPSGSSHSFQHERRRTDAASAQLSSRHRRLTAVFPQSNYGSHIFFLFQLRSGPNSQEDCAAAKAAQRRQKQTLLFERQRSAQIAAHNYSEIDRVVSRLVVTEALS